MLYTPSVGRDRMPEIELMVVMRPFEATINGLNAFVTRNGPPTFTSMTHWKSASFVSTSGPTMADARVVDEAVEATARLGDRLDRSRDVGRVGDVESHGFDVLDRVELGEVAVLAGARVDEIAVLREPLGDLAADAGAGARDQHGLLRGGSARRSQVRHRRPVLARPVPGRACRSVRARRRSIPSDVASRVRSSSLLAPGYECCLPDGTGEGRRRRGRDISTRRQAGGITSPD